MSLIVEKLRALSSKLSDALQARDWEAIKKLDEELRHRIEACGEGEKSGADFQQALSDLKDLYALLIGTTLDDRDDAALELKRFQKESQAANHYLDLSKI